MIKYKLNRFNISLQYIKKQEKNRILLYLVNFLIQVQNDLQIEQFKFFKHNLVLWF